MYFKRQGYKLFKIPANTFYSESQLVQSHRAATARFLYIPQGPLHSLSTDWVQLPVATSPMYFKRQNFQLFSLSLYPQATRNMLDQSIDSVTKMRLGFLQRQVVAHPQNPNTKPRSFIAFGKRRQRPLETALSISLNCCSNLAFRFSGIGYSVPKVV